MKEVLIYVYGVCACICGWGSVILYPLIKGQESSPDFTRNAQQVEHKANKASGNTVTK